MAEGEKIIKINIEEEMKSAYIDYSMSVIVSRALPDVRDGLKPVHRRVLFGMYELGNLSNRPTKKSARIVGEVLGKFHPHGDSSVYYAMVRMAQEWMMRYRLVDGQGNFGSVDGDSPAAMRYTEARLTKIAEETLADIDKNTVNFQNNFDDTLQEPTVLPTRIPLLLVNGASGIAVGMATNMPPHNLSETCDAINAFVDSPDITIDELMHYIKAPDFPTGGIIYGYQGVRDAFETGRGKIVVRSKCEIETTPSGRGKIVITEIPYMVNKAELIKSIADMINEKTMEGIAYINDESDREGMRIVIILKKEAVANVVLNNLYKHTQLQTAFNVNNVALVNGKPKTLNLIQLIDNFVKHRQNVIIRRTQFDLEQAEKKAHILLGLLIALDHLDEVIALIRASLTPDEAQNGLMNNFQLTEIQAKAILDMRLQRLVGLERQKIKDEYDELVKLIAHLKEILADESLRKQIIKDELNEIKQKYGDERKTEIIRSAEEFIPEDFYADDEMVVTISHLGYIKRTPSTEFKTQNRGGKGMKGSSSRDEDFIENMFSATMHNTMLFFTEKGKCFWLKVYNIPEGSKVSKGRAIQNIINIEPDDTIKAFINVKSLENEEYINNNFIVLCTQHGIIKKTSLEAYSHPRQKGINAINVREGDTLLEAKLTNGKNNIILAIRSGKALRFPEEKVRPMGRTASGVKGISFNTENDQVIGMICIESENQDVLVVSENGYGKRSKVGDYRITNRGGKGVKTINITDKTGNLIAIKTVTDDEDLMIINKSGLTIRVAVKNLRVSGRATQGVRLINLRGKDSIAAVSIVQAGEEETEGVVEGEGEGNIEGNVEVEGIEGNIKGKEENTDTAENENNNPSENE